MIIHFQESASEVASLLKKRAESAISSGMPITVQTHFFARLREQVGVEQTPVQLPEGSSVADLARLLEEQYGVPLGGVMVAVNEDYATPATRLHDGDVVALLPPVAGGA